MKKSIRILIAVMVVSAILLPRVANAISSPTWMLQSQAQYGKKDGSIDIGVRVSLDLDKKVNSGFRGTWLNSGNIGMAQADIITIWNTDHPEDQISVED
jgi:hypothetical protein